MRRAWMLATALAIGCQGLERPNGHWMQQINSANEIPDLDLRGGTLERVVESASYSGDLVAARYSLAQLGDGPQRDELAARCALLLANHDPEKGRAFVEEIDDSTLRTETLAKLDKSNQKETPQAEPAKVEPNESRQTATDVTTQGEPPQADDAQTDPGRPAGQPGPRA